MIVSEKRWILSVVTAVVLAVTMLFSPATVLAAGEDSDEAEPQVQGTPYSFINSDGEEVDDAYQSDDGYVFRVVNSDGTEEEPNYVAKIYGDLNASGKTEIDVPDQLGGFPVVSIAMDPRYPVAEESYDAITSLKVPASLIAHHYLAYFDGLKAIDVAAGNPKYKSGDDGVMYWYDAEEEEVGVSVYPRGKSDTRWVMPNDVTRNYRFFEGCPLERLTIGAGLEYVSPYDLEYLTELKAVEVAEGSEFHFAQDGVLFCKEDWGDDTEELVNVLVYYPKAKKDTEYTIPAGTVKVDDDAFTDVSALQKLVLSEDITRFYSQMNGCDNLKTIEFTAKAAPSEEDYDYFGDLRDFVSKTNDLELVAPEGGTGYDAFFEWLGEATEEDDDIGFAEVPEDPIPIRVDEEKTVLVDEGHEVATFIFIPEISGIYSFISIGEGEDYDPAGVVFTNDERIGYGDDDSGYNFRIDFAAEKGQTYYLQTKAFNEDTEITVKLVEAEIDEHEHEFEAPEYEWSKDNTEVTATRVCSFDNCPVVEKETAKVTSSVIREATCGAKGQTRYTAVFENPAFKKQTKTLTDIPKLAHHLTATEAKDATYEAEGNIAYWTCSECGTIFSDDEGYNDITLAETVIPKLVMEAGAKASVSGSDYTVTSPKAKTVAFTKAKNAKSVTVPATVKLPDGKTYKVTQVNAGAFAGSKIKTVTISKNIKTIKGNAFKKSKATKMIVKTKSLTKKSVKGSLKGSKIKTVQVKVGSKKVNKKFVKKYKKIFTKKVAGKKVAVK